MTDVAGTESEFEAGRRAFARDLADAVELMEQTGDLPAGPDWPNGIWRTPWSDISNDIDDVEHFTTILRSWAQDGAPKRYEET